MTARPWLLLDVDGVLSPYGRASGAWRDWQAVPNRHDVDLPLSPTMAAHLAGLDVDRVWLTSWRDEANTTVAAAFGWQPSPVLVGGTPDGQLPFAAKLDAVRRLLERDPRPTVWVDDELDGTAGVHAALRRFGVPLLLAPKRRVGMTLRHLNEIRRFVDDVGAQTT